MIVAGIQHDIVWEDREANFARLAPMIERAAGDGARLIVCTEMFSTGFSMRTDVTAEPIDGPSEAFVRAQAAQHGVWVCGSAPVRTDRALPYNRLLLASPTGALHTYDKIHPFTYGGETDHFSAGQDFVTVNVEGVRCSLFVCYDLRFADEFWALAPHTDCYLVPANWPTSRRAHWQALLTARAIENQAYVVGVNRVGTGGKLEYSGDSRIVDPLGEIVADAGESETIITVDVDPARVEQVRTKFPFLPDRR
jgi:predicted amidohydrolase